MRRRWWRLIILTTFLTIVVLAGVYLRQTSVAQYEVEQLVRKNPPGTPFQQVRSYVLHHGYEHEYADGGKTFGYRVWIYGSRLPTLIVVDVYFVKFEFDQKKRVASSAFHRYAEGF